MKANKLISNARNPQDLEQVLNYVKNKVHMENFEDVVEKGHSRTFKTVCM